MKKMKKTVSLITSRRTTTKACHLPHVAYRQRLNESNQGIYYLAIIHHWWCVWGEERTAMMITMMMMRMKVMLVYCYHCYKSSVMVDMSWVVSSTLPSCYDHHDGWIKCSRMQTFRSQKNTATAFIKSIHFTITTITTKRCIGMLMDDVGWCVFNSMAVVVAKVHFKYFTQVHIKWNVCM